MNKHKKKPYWYMLPLLCIALCASQSIAMTPPRADSPMPQAPQITNGSFALPASKKSTRKDILLMPPAPSQVLIKKAVMCACQKARLEKVAETK